MGDGDQTCTRCGRRLAEGRDAIEVLGLHEHDVANPDGQRWRVRCFARAHDLVTTTNPSGEWSWFPGHRWQTQACAGCGALAGWRFRREAATFYALVT